MKIRKSLKFVSVFLALSMIVELFSPIAAYALTGGPSQPEVQSFEPVGTTEMVDIFSGDFVYNIPLMDVEGFPINMSYHSGVGMDDEASWVGLGWNINMGSITRNLRGMPDDLNGDVVKRETNILENRTYGVTGKTSFEIFGWEKESKTEMTSDTTSALHLRSGDISLGLGLGVFYNNYRGMGYEFSITPSLGALDKIECSHPEVSTSNRIGLGITANTQTGLDIEPQFSSSKKLGESGKYKNSSFSFGPRYNSREGLTDLTWNAGKERNKPKKYDVKNNYNIGSTISIGHAVFNPKLQNSFTNESYNFDFQWGNEFFGSSLTIGTGAYYTGQNIHNNSESFKAYGYMYSHNGEQAEKEKVMYDFSRSNDGSFSKDKNILPLTNFTYDLFNVAGEGTGGMFRSHRGDVGVVHDPEVGSNTVGLGLGFQYGGTQAFKLGMNINGNNGYSRSGKWYNGNKELEFHDYVGFQNPKGRPLYEHAYFKSAGEKNVIDEDYYNTLFGDKAIRPKLTKVGGKRIPVNQITDKDNTVKTFSSGITRGKRDKRNQAITYLTGREASMALDVSYKSYELNHFRVDSASRQAIFEAETVPANSFASIISRPKNDKLSEVTVLNPDGGRYVYGIPAINHTQVDAVFNVVNNNYPNLLSTDKTKGLVKYETKDNTLGNTKGEDHFYNKNTLPSYAHSFLLTSVLSQDYVDVRGDGVTKDDLGSAININYTRAYQNYKWRTPHGGDTAYKANYNQGGKSDIYDDKGQYIYGEKEIWYVHSVESKNFIACFYISKRLDAAAVLGENGGKDNESSFYKLDSIRLFTKQEMIQYPGNPTPIKTAHFEYDYSLCNGIENYVTGNTEKGKLTLKKVYFTYGKSNKGRISPYQFTYSDFNPNYSMQGYDRWGNYKRNASSSDINNLSNANTQLSNGDDPYVMQNKDTADKYASAWHLTTIKIPSGGLIEVNYESDDYGHIQNKTAGQMFKVIGTHKAINYDGSNNLVTLSKLYDGNYDDYVYTFFDLQKPVSKAISGDSLNAIKDLYFKTGTSSVYFKFLTDLTNDNDREFVSGYGDVEETGFISKSSGGSNYDVGYVKFKEVSRNDNENQENLAVHPIAKSAWYFLKSNFPKKLNKLHWGEEYKPGGTGGGVLDVLKALAGTFGEMKNLWAGETRIMRNKDAGNNIVLNKCFIRLNNPYKTKYGGGSRVQKVTINDNWSNMTTSGEDASYGQEYEYTTEIQLGKGMMKISSGVATYEPMIGNDENPFKQPIYFTKKKALAADDRYYIEEPVGEEFLPPASIGYSKVTVKNIKPDVNISRTGTGKTEHQFYTSKDFPSITDRTAWEFEAPPQVGKYNPFPLKYIRTKSFATQGHLVILNDMHGKPKSQAYYREGSNTPYSKISYFYKQEVHPTYGVNSLINDVDVLNEDGSISHKIVGKNIDVVFDSRQSESYNFNTSYQLNLDAFVLGFLPGIAPSVWPKFSIVDTEMGTEVATKVVYTFGLLDRTLVEEEGAQITTENILYDAETGDVLLTKTQNEYSDPIYNFTYPAHLAYSGMEQAYKNIGASFKNVRFTGGKINISNFEEYFEPGDECYLEKVYGTTEDNQIIGRIWAVETNHTTSKFIFMSRSGHPVHMAKSNHNIYNLKIIRSGKRNMQSIGVGAFTSLSNPVKTSGGSKMFSLDNDSILNVSSVEYSDRWPVRYNYVTTEYIPEPPSIESPSCDDPRTCDQKFYDSFNIRLIQYERKNGLFPVAPPKPPTITYIFSSPLFNVTEGAVTYNSYDSMVGDFHACGERCWPYDPGYNDFNEPPAGVPPLPSSWIEMSNNYSPVKSNNILEDNFKKIETSNWMNSLAMAQKEHGPNASLNISYSPSPNAKSSVSTVLPVSVTITQTAACFVRIDSNFAFDPNASDAPCSLASNEEYRITPTGTWGRDICIRFPDSDSLFMRKSRFYCICIDTIVNYNCSEGIYTDTLILHCSNIKSLPCPGGYGNSECYTSYLHEIVNPYVQGIKGNFRPKKSWSFYDKRNQSASTNLRKDGTLLNFSPFWNKPATSKDKWSADSTKWIWTEVSRKFTKSGEESENQNVLGINNAAIYGYGESLPTGVVYNSKLRQAATDNFEDYDYYLEDKYDHFSFYKAYNKMIDSNNAHTGLRSMFVDSNTSVSVTKGVFYPEKMAFLYADSIQDASYRPLPTDYIENFSPDSGKYIISAWVKEKINIPVATYTSNSILITFKTTNGTESVSFTSAGPIIEGWQRYEGVFRVPDSLECFSVTLIAGINDAYFDDIRIYPAKARMKSFVYNPVTLRLAAELDENNYATFYEYDLEGRLVRIKRETERGIVTIQESRTGLKKVD